MYYMRNPWVHDDMSEPTGPGYDGRIRLLGALVWGALLVAVGLFVLLTATGTVNFTIAESLTTIVTYVVIALALALVLPILLKLLAISRLLTTVAFLATSGVLGRFLWARESERLGRFVAEHEILSGTSGSIDQLIELVDVLLGMM